ncbi:SMI1/KNR4 family protein [Streptomyces sp. S6]
MPSDLTCLTELLPHPRLVAPATDWATAETTLRTSLPTDYRALITTYGAGLIDNYLLLLEPGCPDDVYDQLKISAEREEANSSLWQYDDKPTELEPDGNRLICWATTDNGEYLYWLVQPGDDPDSRPILINSDSDWERHDMTTTRFLASVLAGDITSDALWSRFPRRQHEFRPAREM